MQKQQGFSSDDYVESLQAVTSDPFDSSSWKILLDEIEAGRGGNADFGDSMSKFLGHFPRAGGEWIRYAEYYENKAKDLVRAERTLGKSAESLRSVAVWLKYIELVKKLAVEQHGESTAEAQGAIRNALGDAYEKAADNVGLTINSGALWRSYIDFVDSWPDAAGMDPGKKLAAARKVYHSSLIVPMEELDYMYTKYEQFEKAESEHLAREVLPEWEKRYLSSKALLNDRKAITNRISFNRLATPPTKSLVEISQINSWNKWIRYEFGNPCNLEEETLKEMMKMVFEMCLCSFRHHAEVWLSYADFAVKREDHSYARKILLDAIETIPGVSILRFASAEILELEGNTDAARHTLKQAYEQIPSGLTFSVFQRFIRRHDGFIAARKLFSETQHLRQEKRVGFDIYMAHAQLELEGNGESQVAVKVLSLCKAAYPTESTSVAFIRLLVRALLRLNDLKQIQWEFNSLLARACAGAAGAAPFSIGDSALPTVAASMEELSKDHGKPGEALLTLQDQLELWNDYLQVETTVGLSSLKRLNELRSCRDAALRSLQEYRAKESIGQDGAATAAAAAAKDANKSFKGMYEMVPRLGERYGSHVTRLPLLDTELQKRCSVRGRQTSGQDRGGLGGSEDLPLPPVLQSFLSRLPAHTGPEPDIDQYIRRFKVLVLPPRPSAETEAENDLLLVGSKRNAPAEWLNQGGADEGDGIDYEMQDTYTSRDDVFRHRQRARLH